MNPRQHLLLHQFTVLVVQDHCLLLLFPMNVFSAEPLITASLATSESALKVNLLVVVNAVGVKRAK